MTAALPSLADLIEQLDHALPQTQCTRCGYPDCRAYAEAMARGDAGINQCPPGGAEGIERLARLTGRPALPLSAEHGLEGPRTLAVIDEAWCIGCTLCIPACPVDCISLVEAWCIGCTLCIKACPADCISGAPKLMHTIVAEQCTGCELCIPACPVDCISLVEATPGRSGWAAWSDTQAQEARERYRFKQFREQREAQENAERLAAKAQHKLAHLAELTKPADDAELQRKRSVIEAALARARAKREG